MTKPVLVLFWSKVDIQEQDECWNWKASTQSGYGQFITGIRHRLSSKASRVSWILTHGPIPEGLQVLHKCDNKLCCNPYHLFLGTHQDNMADKVRKGRQVKGEQHPKVKLKKEQVLSIYLDPRPRPLIARDYCVSVSLISRIQRGKSWVWLTQMQRRVE